MQQDGQLSFLDLVDEEEKTEVLPEEIREYEGIDNNPPYEIGDKIRVNITVTEEEDSESYHYMKQFEKRCGIILEVIINPSLQYKVDFGGLEAFLYHHELTI
jgi:hypothetical protein